MPAAVAGQQFYFYTHDTAGLSGHVVAAVVEQPVNLAGDNRKSRGYLQ